MNVHLYIIVNNANEVQISGYKLYLNVVICSNQSHRNRPVFCRQILPPNYTSAFIWNQFLKSPKSNTTWHAFDISVWLWASISLYDVVPTERVEYETVCLIENFSFQTRLVRGSCRAGVKIYGHRPGRGILICYK